MLRWTQTRQTMWGTFDLLRLPLWPTAIADAWCIELLAYPVSPARLGWIALASSGLYGIGMTLNDIVDRRRDRAAGRLRPLAQARLSPSWAWLVLASCSVGVVLAAQALGPRSTVAIIACLIFISLYNFGAKFVPEAGLLLLGLIRATNAQIPGQLTGLGFNISAVLLIHVVALSALAYTLERKPPMLGRVRRNRLLLGLTIVATILLGLLGELPAGLAAWMLLGMMGVLFFYWLMVYRQFALGSLAGPPAGVWVIRTALPAMTAAHVGLHLARGTSGQTPALLLGGLLLLGLLLLSLRQRFGPAARPQDD